MQNDYQQESSISETKIMSILRTTAVSDN